MDDRPAGRRRTCPFKTPYCLPDPNRRRSEPPAENLFVSDIETGIPFVSEPTLAGTASAREPLHRRKTPHALGHKAVGVAGTYPVPCACRSTR